MISDIRIYRDFSIINDYVQVPPNREIDKSRVDTDRSLDTVRGSEVVELSLGSGHNTGSKLGAERLLRLPPLRPGETYLLRYGFDPQADLLWTHGTERPTTDSA